MITGPLRKKIDKLWLEFWQGGITNPLTVIEQISYLMFARLLDVMETTGERRAGRSLSRAATSGLRTCSPGAATATTATSGTAHRSSAWSGCVDNSGGARTSPCFPMRAFRRIWV